MTNERVNEIRAALDAFEGVLNLPPTSYELEDAKNEFLAVTMNGLRELLAENEQLTKVVDAVKAYAPVEYQGRIYDTPREWQSVLDALAALPDTEAGDD